MKLKVSRQPKVSALLRIFAGTCALLWLAGIAVGGMGPVCTCADHEGDCAVHASPVHEHDAEAHQHAMASQHHDGATPQPCAGKNGCTCGCSTLQTLIPTMTPVVVPEPVSQPVSNISLLRASRQHLLTAPPSETLRRAKPRDWVFTPVVCLGPAFHSLAPPAFV